MASQSLAPAQQTAPSSTSTPSKPKPSHPPVSILSSQFARGYALAHPAILLSLVAYRFSSVVHDPVAELLSDIPFLVGLQAVYVMGCLPPAGAEKDGSTSADGTTRKTTGPKRRGHSASKGSSWSTGLVSVAWKLTVRSFRLNSLLLVNY
jgi:phosphatidylinositol glycan class F